MAERPVAQSMFPDVVPDKPTGPLYGSVQGGTNADLIATVAPTYLTGSVLDVTYGEGKWWDRFTPSPFTYHDLYKHDGVDFRHLPEATDSVDTVCFDPPYVPQGGTGDARAVNFRDRFGLQEQVAEADLRSLIAGGMYESCRVARRFVLVKCMEFTSGGRFHDMPAEIRAMAGEAGWKVWDVIVHHTGGGIGGHNIWTQIRARRHHSYLIVFAPGGKA